MAPRDELLIRSWPEYIQHYLDVLGLTQKDLGRIAGVHSTQIGRWLRDEAEPTIDGVRQVAKAVRGDLRVALVASGHFTPEEMSLGPLKVDLRMFTDDELLADVCRRMRGQAAEQVDGDVSTLSEESGVDTTGFPDTDGRPLGPLFRAAGR